MATGKRLDDAERLARHCVHCGRPGWVARQLCRGCYNHWQRHGTLPPGDLPRRRAPRKPAACAHCGRWDYYLTRDGLCTACYNYRRLTGHLRALEPVPPPAPPPAPPPEERLYAELCRSAAGAPPPWLAHDWALSLVPALLDALRLRERVVLGWRCGLGGEPPHTWEQVAQRLGVTSERARQIGQDGLQRLRARLARLWAPLHAAGGADAALGAPWRDAWARGHRWQACAPEEPEPAWGRWEPSGADGRRWWEEYVCSGCGTRLRLLFVRQRRRDVDAEGHKTTHDTTVAHRVRWESAAEEVCRRISEGGV